MHPGERTKEQAVFVFFFFEALQVLKMPFLAASVNGSMGGGRGRELLRKRESFFSRVCMLYYTLEQEGDYRYPSIRISGSNADLSSFFIAVSRSFCDCDWSLMLSLLPKGRQITRPEFRALLESSRLHYQSLVESSLAFKHNLIHIYRIASKAGQELLVSINLCIRDLK